MHETKLLRNFRKISSIFFLQLNINDIKTVNHEYIPSKKLENPYRLFKVLAKFNEIIFKKLCRLEYAIIISDYFSLREKTF